MYHLVFEMTLIFIVEQWVGFLLPCTYLEYNLFESIFYDRYYSSRSPQKPDLELTALATRVLASPQNLVSPHSQLPIDQLEK